MIVERSSWTWRTAASLASFVLCAAWLVVAAGREWWITDDALITFRYLDNLAAGLGLVYNPGERLEAFSSPLFVALLAPARLLGANLFVAAAALGLMFALVELGLLTALLGRFGGVPLAAIVAGVLFAGDRIVQVWATGGLETSSYAALVSASLLCTIVQLRGETSDAQVTRAAVVHLLLALARPEGLAFYAIHLGVLAWHGRGGAWRRSLPRSLMIVATGVAMLLALRWAYYGTWLPHTYAAKLHDVPTAEFGRGYLLAFAVREGFVGISLLVWLAAPSLAAIALLASRRAQPASISPARRELLAIALLGAAYVLLGLVITYVEGGDYMTDFRFVRPVFGPLCASVAALVGLAHVSHLPALRAAAFMVAAALFLNHSAHQRTATPIFADAPPPAAHKRNNTTTQAEAEAFAAALARITEPGDALLTDVTGRGGHGHTLRTVDATGLTTAEIADNFYLRPEWATEHYRDRLPGHARWPKLEYLRAQGFALITPKISSDGHDVPEVHANSHRRYRRYRFLHATLALGDGNYLRFFTTLSADELARRAAQRGLDLCWRAPGQEQPFCAGMDIEAPHAPRRELEQPAGIEASTRKRADTPTDAVKQFFGAMAAADCAWLRATTAGIQAERDGQLTCAQLHVELEHLAPIRLWSIESERPGRNPHERLLEARFFLEGKDRIKLLTVEQIDGAWRVTRL